MKPTLFAAIIFAALLSSTANAQLKIVYIRHAEGGHNVKKAWQAKGIPESEWPAYVGDHDAFTPKGLKEVVAATEDLKKHSFDFIATSPAWRARNTIMPYLRATNQTAEIWPELREAAGMQTILSDDLPDVEVEILNNGEALVVPKDEADVFTIRQGAENDYQKYPRGCSEEVKVAYTKHVSQHAIKLIEERFGGSDKTILLAGHNSSGVSLLKLLIQHEPTGDARRGLNSTGGWMVEQQADGTYELKIYNGKPYQPDEQKDDPSGEKRKRDRQRSSE